MSFQLFRIRRPEFRHCGSDMAFGSVLILTASAFGADRPTEDTWSVRTMGIWSEPKENDLSILTNGDELELGFDDSFGFSAAIGWQPKGFAFGFELEYRSTEHELAQGTLPSSVRSRPMPPAPSRPFSSTRLPGKSLAWTSPSLAASAWGIPALILTSEVWAATPTSMSASSPRTPLPSKALLDLKNPSPMIWALSPNLAGSRRISPDLKMN